MMPPGERFDEPNPHSGETGSISRLRMRVCPEAVIIVTERNRIVLVDSPSWSLEDFNRREIVEILLPEGFRPSSPDSSQVADALESLPVELFVRKQPERSPSPESAKAPARSDTPATPERLIDTGIVQHSDYAIGLIGRDGRVLSWNSGAEYLYGYSSAEMLGKPVADLVPHELRAMEERKRKRALEGENIPAFDTQRTAKAGTAIDMSVSFSRVQDASGAVVATLEIGRDIRKRLQEAKSLADQLTSMTQSNRELQDYAMTVAHDLQSPLNLVASYFARSSERSGQPDDEDIARLRDTASAAVFRMHKLITDLLEMARLDGQPSEQVQTDCTVVVAQAVANLEMAIKGSGATVTVGRMPVVLADPTQLMQVFQNLISNAIKFRSDRPPAVHINAELRPGEWRFSVSDNGIGIEPALIPRIFQPLQRLQPGGPQPGSGLGLAIARKIMTRHGGRIWADAKPGIGSTFYFTLPTTDLEDSRGPG